MKPLRPKVTGWSAQCQRAPAMVFVSVKSDRLGSAVTLDSGVAYHGARFGCAILINPRNRAGIIPANRSAHRATGWVRRN